MLMEIDVESIVLIGPDGRILWHGNNLPESEVDRGPVVADHDRKLNPIHMDDEQVAALPKDDAAVRGWIRGQQFSIEPPLDETTGDRRVCLVLQRPRPIPGTIEFDDYHTGATNGS